MVNTSIYHSINYAQKLLLLPELSGTAVTGTDSDSVKSTSKSHSPDLMCTEPINCSTDRSLPDDVAPRVMVKHLTASWTHVSKEMIIYHHDVILSN